tara:strand:+ start:1614 stop:2675 length:1062 start_codon:yes stop_codon:yes gene_type:complete
MKRILVTGGCGYIGSHTALSLLERGNELIIVDSLVNSFPIVIQKIKRILKLTHPKIRSQIHLVNCDLDDFDSLENVFKQFSKDKPISAVMHFAGLKAVSDSISFPLSYWNANVSGTINLLKIMDEFNCRNIVFSSSATIYGSKENRKNLKEGDSKNPLNTYGETKYTIEKILSSLIQSNKKDWRIAILRYFNPIGAHPSGIIGESPKNYATNIMPIITNVALRKREYLNIFGDNYNTPDGTPIRDYIHVEDLAEGHIKALEHLFEGKSNQLILNLGTGKGNSVLELIHIFEKVNNISIPYKFASRRSGDIEYSVADNLQAKKLLNWEPNKDIEDMCKDSWNWVSKNPNGYLNI